MTPPPTPVDAISPRSGGRGGRNQKAPVQILLSPPFSLGSEAVGQRAFPPPIWGEGSPSNMAFQLFLSPSPPPPASANICNVVLMRHTELEEGIDVLDAEGNVVGSSRIAARHVCASRGSRLASFARGRGDWGSHQGGRAEARLRRERGRMPTPFAPLRISATGRGGPVLWGGGIPLLVKPFGGSLHPQPPHSALPAEGWKRPWHSLGSTRAGGVLPPSSVAPPREGRVRVPICGVANREGDRRNSNFPDWN